MSIHTDLADAVLEAGKDGRVYRVADKYAVAVSPAAAALAFVGGPDAVELVPMRARHEAVLAKMISDAKGAAK